MSRCNKVLYDYDLVKKRCRCGNAELKSNFHKTTLSKDGFCNQCKVC